MSTRYPKLQQVMPTFVEQAQQEIAEDEEPVEKHAKNVEGLARLKQIFDENDRLA